jgi:hypothetical protein
MYKKREKSTEISGNILRKKEKKGRLRAVFHIRWIQWLDVVFLVYFGNMSVSVVTATVVHMGCLGASTKASKVRLVTT